MVLESDEVVAVGAEVLLAELHDGVGPAASLRIGEADGLHGAEAQGVAAAAGGLFDGEAAFEVLQLFWRGTSAEICDHTGKMRGFFPSGKLRVRMTILYFRGTDGDLFPFFGGDGLGGGEGVEEAVVLFFGEGAVDVVGRALVVAGGEINLVHVDGGGVDDG